MKIPFEWEELDNYTERLKVIGGWIIKSENSLYENGKWALSESMVFVPDPNHEWEIDTLEDKV